MNNYYVIEIQSHSNGTSGVLSTGYPDKLSSEDAFLAARASANDSTVACHTVMWINKEGRNMEDPVCYHHNEPLPETENQEEPQEP